MKKKNRFEFLGIKLNNNEKKAKQIMRDVFEYKCGYETSRKELVLNHLYSQDSEYVEVILTAVIVCVTAAAAFAYILLSFSSLTTSILLSTAVLALSMSIINHRIKMYRRFLNDAKDYMSFNDLANKLGVEKVKQLLHDAEKLK